MPEMPVEGTKLTRPELINEIRKITNQSEIPDISKVIHIEYLIKHNFEIAEDEPLPNIYWPDECAPDGTCLPESMRGVINLKNEVQSGVVNHV